MTVPPLDISRILDLQRKNLSAMTQSWLLVANGAGTIAARQHELAARALTDMTEMLRGFLPDGNPQEAIARPAEFAKKAIEVMIANTRDIAEVVQKSGIEVFGVVQERIVGAVADWLSDPAHSAMLGDFVLQKLPPTLAAIDRSGLPSFVGQQIRTELERVEIAPLATRWLSAVLESGRHQQLPDELLGSLEKLVSNRPAMEVVREKVRAKLPALFNLYRGEPVVMNKIIDSTIALIAEIRADPAHPVRAELDGYLTAFIERLRSSPELAGRLDAVKLDFLGRPELADVAAGVWNGLRDFLVRDSRSEDSQLRRRLVAMLVDVGGVRPDFHHWLRSSSFCPGG